LREKATLRVQECPLHGKRETNPEFFPDKSNSQKTTMKMFGQKHESRKHERAKARNRKPSEVHFDARAKSQETVFCVIPATAGIQLLSELQMADSQITSDILFRLLAER